MRGETSLVNEQLLPFKVSGNKLSDGGSRVQAIVVTGVDFVRRRFVARRGIRRRGGGGHRTLNIEHRSERRMAKAAWRRSGGCQTFGGARSAAGMMRKIFPASHLTPPSLSRSSLQRMNWRAPLAGAFRKISAGRQNQPVANLRSPPSLRDVSRVCPPLPVTLLWHRASRCEARSRVKRPPRAACGSS